MTSCSWLVRSRSRYALTVCAVLGVAGLVGCSAQPAAGPGVPAYTPDPTTTAVTAADATPTTPTPSLSPSLAPLTPEGLSDATAHYTLESLPPDLGKQEQDMVRGFVAYDIATWVAVQKVDGDLTAVEATTTGTDLEDVKSALAKLQAEGKHREGHQGTAVLAVYADDPFSGEMKVCIDQRESVLRDSAGNDITPSTSKHRFTFWVRMDAISGTWKVNSLEQTGVDDC